MYDINQKYQKILNNLPRKNRDSFQKSIILGSLFSRPLYIGYTNNLSRRYSEHVNGYGGENTFHKRFYKFMEHLKKEEISQNNDKNIDEYKIKIEDLLFVCLKDARRDISEEELKLTEEVLKTLANPVFSTI